jgi:hypothetical protein
MVYEPLHSDVYNYLHRLSVKGVIEFDDIFKPLPRKLIYEKLNEADAKRGELTDLEIEELEYFKKDYLLEKTISVPEYNEEHSGFLSGDTLGRSRLFSYQGKFLKINVSPVLGYKVTWEEKERTNHTWNGLNTFGYLPSNIGFSFDFRINNEAGNWSDQLKTFTPATGIIANVNKRSIDYSEVKALVSYDWDWGNAAAAKEFINYGYAKSGNVILSDKAPSFPHLRLQVNPADWINFAWFHAWLSSNIMDTVNYADYKRNIFRSKYFAWHALRITPFEGFDVSIGESVVYSDKPELIYLMPLMFYFLVDDFISSNRGQPGDANCQFFLSVSSKDHLKNTHLYGTLFVDELTLRGMSGFLVPDNAEVLFDESRLQLAFTLGASAADILLDNSEITLEYTKIYPYVYGHHTSAQTYTNSSYTMGHWMGHNGDLVHLGLNYRFFRGFRVNLWGEYIRKGSSDYKDQYIRENTEFLFGLRNNYKYIGADIKYELMHELNIEAGLRWNSESHEESGGGFADNKVNEFSISVYYGL